MSIVVSLALFLLALFVYRRHLSPKGDWWLFMMRLVVIALFAFILIGQAINLTSKERPNRLVLLVDRSLSMKAIGEDGVVREVKEEIIQKLPKGLKPEFWIFGETAYVAPAEDQDGYFERTRMGRALELAALTKPGGVVLLSDGQDNGEKDPAEVIKKLKVPVYAIGFGGGAGRNVRLSDVTVPMMVYAKETVNIKVRLSGSGFSEMERLRLRAGEQVREVMLKGDFSEQEVEFPLVFFSPGRQKFWVRVESLAGELTYVDNQRDVVIDVKPGKTNVLYFTNRPGMGTRFILNALRKNPRVALKEIVVTRNGTIRPEALNGMDVVVLDGCTEGADNGFWERLLQRVQAGMGLLVIAGENFVAGNKLASLLPVKDLAIKKGVFTAQVNSKETYLDWFEPGKVDLNSVPPFTGMISGEPKDDKTLVWLEAVENGLPLLVARRKVVFLGAWPIWRWGFIPDLPLERETPLEILLDRVIRYLGEDTEVQFRLEADAHNYHSGEPVRLRFYALTPDGNPWEGLEVGVNLDSERLTMPMIDNGGGRYEVEIAGVAPGEHVAFVEAKMDGRVVGKAKAGFNVLEQGIELVRLGLNRGLLSRVAHLSGGWFVPAESLNASQINQIQTKVYERQFVIDPRRLPWVFALLTLIFGVELGLRRSKGLY
ncbi:MAG: vWA domain-containing protein [candidate division WOR-3 bacterium]